VKVHILEGKRPSILIREPKACSSKEERRVDYGLDHFKQDSERTEKETHKLLSFCAELRKDAEALTHKAHLHPIEELRKNKTMK